MMLVRAFTLVLLALVPTSLTHGATDDGVRSTGHDGNNFNAGDRDAVTDVDIDTHWDVVVYGAPAGGVVAAVAAARRGARTVLLCSTWPDCYPPSNRVGGLTTGGLGMTDSCHQSDGYQVDTCQVAITGGITKEFYAESNATYQGNTTLSGPNMPYNVEPHVALGILHRMLTDANVTVVYEAAIAETNGVTIDPTTRRITSMRTMDGREFSATVFVDGGYEGDLLAAAGVSYTVGREANTTYNESEAGRRQPSSANENNFHVVVNPFYANGTALPGVLRPEEAAKIAGVPGQADEKIMSYNFRLCVTMNTSNQIPFPRPEVYHAADWELLRRLIEADPNMSPAKIGRPSCNTAQIPNGKFDMNNCGPIASDLTTAEYTNASWRNLTSWYYPRADHATRQEIWRAHRDYQQGLLWFLSHDPDLAPEIRTEMAKWGLCKDEFVETAGWPPSLYVREVRRMVGDTVLTQASVREANGVDINESSIGIAAHAEDSHNMQRFICTDPNTPPCYGTGVHGATPGVAFAFDEGDYHGVENAHPYQIPHYIALPKKSEITNLLVVAAPSASHVAFSTLRMEPAFMVVGNSVGVWAALAAHPSSVTVTNRGDDTQKDAAQPEPSTWTPGAVHDIPLTVLYAQLQKEGQVLKVPPSVNPSPPAPPAIGYDCRQWQRCVEVLDAPSLPNATCDGRCKPLAPNEWLASTDVFKLDGSGTNSTVQSTSTASFLKKSEVHSSKLPASEKLQIPKGQSVTIAAGAASTKEDTYWLVACTQPNCGLP
eukprot:m.79593 g.79593  ORF g.79593 m.79593 type:complete len:771 (-) comp9303_c0_seq2:67-2379(-)